MRLPCDEGCWRGPTFASCRRRNRNPASITRPLDVAGGWNDGVSVFCPSGSLVNLQRELRRSCNGTQLCRGCFWRGCLFGRTCKLSTLARCLANCNRRCTGSFRQELTRSSVKAAELYLKSDFPCPIQKARVWRTHHKFLQVSAEKKS